MDKRSRYGVLTLFVVTAVIFGAVAVVAAFGRQVRVPVFLTAAVLVGAFTVLADHFHRSSEA